MRVLVVGHKGMLGRAVIDESANADYEEIIGVDLEEIDITDPDRAMSAVTYVEPTAVVNCAAYTDVDGCETETELAFLVNGEGPGNLAVACREAGARLVHVSTDFVFDGGKGEPYVEEDEPNPRSVYGSSKLEGERNVSANLEDHVIVRTSWLFGRGGNNFVDKILARAEAGEKLRVVEDQVGSPTYARHLARAIKQILDTDYRGTVHAANTGAVSWYGFAEEILAAAGYEADLEMITSAELAAPARRPAYSVLNTDKLEILVGEALPPWQVGLEYYLREIGEYKGLK
ncbi:MAG: dTDP-4-dehydrorhamnose reductase [Candidatus Coatesbacteria bacterium]|nr:MAG: dTDP-4-dehydrorhamnose reductase [Candidatus Coatesbacteria bacterium]